MVFGEGSKGNLDTCHNDLQLIANEAIKITPIDFGVSEGHRSVERQNKLFKEGKSKIDGINKKGKHNYSPSLAFDIYIYVKGKSKLAYDEKHLTFIGGVLIATAKRLYSEGKITHILRWGANWDGDGELIYDQSFQDLPHFELKKPNL
jgi:peptidoglycan L-alanyl-D-glutamate endopeptidase CwlK